MVPLRSASSTILGSGTAFPSCVTPTGETITAIDTDALFLRLTPEMSDDRRAPILAHLKEAVGIESRSWAHWPGTEFRDDEEDAATLGVAAGKRALADAKLEPKDIGFVVVATSTPPRWTAATSALVAGGLGANCGFLDVRSGCAGGLYATVLGAMLADAGGKPVLVVGTDTFSKVTPDGERFAVLTMGDGAGALVIGKGASGAGLRAAAFGGDGENHHLATVLGTMPPRTLDRAVWTLTGDPEEFSKRIEAVLGEAMGYAMGACDGEPTLALVHAARRGVCHRVAAAAKVKAPVFTASLERHGNLGAASVVVALHEARAAGLLTNHATVAIASAGGGPSWGGAVWTVG